MRDFTGVLLASDLDGTLLDEDQRVSPENARAIRGFIERGGRFAMATGRSLMAMANVRPHVPFNAPLIVLNGAVIYDCEAERILYAEALRPETCALGVLVHQRFPDLGMEVLCLKHKYAVNRNAQIQAQLDFVCCAATDIASLTDAPGEWYKVLCVDTPERLAPVYRWLNEEYGGGFDICFSGPTLLEIQNKGLTKGAAVARVARMLGAREVYCAGDNGNDVPMMRAYPSFAPENAIDECKRAALAVGPHHNRDFLAFVIAEMEKL